MKNKVLIFVQGEVGGAERMSVLIGKNLDTLQFDVCFCIICRNAKSSIIDFIPPKYRIINIVNKRPINLMIRMLKVILKEKPNIIFSSVLNLNNKYLPFRWMFPKIKIIIRSDNYLYTYRRKQQKIVNILYPLADCIIAQTQEMKDELVEIAGIKASKIIVLQNPIDKQTIDIKVQSESPFKENHNKNIVAVGRFHYQKGFDLLIKAFIQLYKTRNNIDLYIVGNTESDNGFIYKNIMQIAERNGILDKIHCVGYTDNPYTYIKNADCYVLSSRWEGLPNVLLESLYLGTPVAAFKCIPIIERIIEEGVNGYCAEKEDSSSLAAAMDKVLELGKIKFSYKSASLEEFSNLFETIL